MEGKTKKVKNRSSSGISNLALLVEPIVRSKWAEGRMLVIMRE